MFLTPEEIEQASGRKRAPQQLAWALARGFVPSPNHTDADGRPLVLRSVFYGVQTEAPKATPNWEAARG